MPEAAVVDRRAVELARAALGEIAPEGAVGEELGAPETVQGTVSLLFRCLLPGYPGWHWVATLARVDEEDPTVLETELVPGEDALLAPDWVPWSERLADYQAAQRALAEAGGDGQDSADEGVDGADEEADDADDEFDDDHDLDADELNGVDVDEFDDDAPEPDEDTTSAAQPGRW